MGWLNMFDKIPFLAYCHKPYIHMVWYISFNHQRNECGGLNVCISELLHCVFVEF